MKSITVEVSDTVYELLLVLAKNDLAEAEGFPRTAQEVVEQLIDHAQQGVYRPGAWERNWLIQAFGEDFVLQLEPGDPYGRTNCDHLFQRPKKNTLKLPDPPKGSQ